MTAVAAGFVAQWNHDGAPVRDALDLALEDAELGWIDQIIGELIARSGTRIFSRFGLGS